MPSLFHRMTKFRIRMDMSQFYDDERNLVYVLVDPKWEQVGCLEEHVQKLFDVPEIHFIADDDVHIPSGESIEIIKSNDVLRAIIPQKRKRKKMKNPGSGDVAEDLQEVGTEKRKHTEERLASSTPHERPRKKRRVTVAISRLRADTVQDQLEARTMLDIYSPQSQSPQQLSDAERGANNDSNVLKQPEEPAQHDTFVAAAEEETVKTRKRKRKKKKGNATRARSPRLSSVPVPISSSTVRLSKSLRTPGRHTHFDDSPVRGEQDSATKKNRIVYRCRLGMEEALEPRDIEAEEITEGAPPPKKPKIVIQENLVLVNANDEHNDATVIEVDESTMRQETDQEEVDQPTDEIYPSISVEEILPLSEPLLDMPKAGEIVLFKMYRLIEGCTPGISEYICGRCEQVDSTNGTMSCLVLDGLDQTDQIPRISIGDGDRIMPNENTNCIMVFLDELLDKKVFRMT